MIVKLVHIIMLVIWPIHLHASSQSQELTKVKPGCDLLCGNFEIPYPFGMNNKGSNCSLDEWFEIECRKSTTPNGIDTPYLKFMGVKVEGIDVAGGMIQIMNPIYRINCRTKDARPHINLQRGGRSPFVYSQMFNKFMAVGCNNIAFLQLNGTDVSGCVSICDNGEINDDYDKADCKGNSCCETSLPLYLSEYSTNITSFKKNQKGHHNCSYAMIVRDNWYLYNELSISAYHSFARGQLKDFNYVPAMLEWEIVDHILEFPADEYARCDATNVTSSKYNYSGRRCSCIYDPYGSYPYIAGGCPVTSQDYQQSRQKWVIMTGVFTSVGSIILLLVLWRLYKVVRKKIVKKRKEKFFKRNGGLLLEQKLSSGEVSVHKVKLFSLKDLEKATDHFNLNRVLGKGGQGTVYKGMLVDGKIVAVKKFKVEGKVEEFINEFVVLSQINHRNVVKLLGSCLETEIPLLVYEFIPNGNLFEYLHQQNEDLPMTWDVRLRIAIEIAGALFYLHSAASVPIYHRDIKSTNILLDERYRAKVADFGTSRMVSIEATHLTTVVQGTFGYLDPEYFRSSQFTEKSDVYSFGVVLVELLTGQKPISSVGTEEARSLASYFIQCMEENRLFDIIDERVLKEGQKEHIIAVTNLASRCLELNGKKRPTMKEVTLELEGIRKLERKGTIQETEERYDELEHLRVEDYQSWTEYSTSNISSTLDVNSNTPSSEGIHILTI